MVVESKAYLFGTLPIPFSSREHGYYDGVFRINGGQMIPQSPRNIEVKRPGEQPVVLMGNEINTAEIETIGLIRRKFRYYESAGERNRRIMKET